MQRDYRTAGFVRLCFEKLLPRMVLLGGSLPCFTAARGTLPVIDDLIVKE